MHLSVRQPCISVRKETNLLEIQGLLHLRISLRTASCLRKKVAKLQSENFGPTKSVSGENESSFLQVELIFTVHLWVLGLFFPVSQLHGSERR